MLILLKISFHTDKLWSSNFTQMPWENNQKFVQLNSSFIYNAKELKNNLNFEHLGIDVRNYGPW